MPSWNEAKNGIVTQLNGRKMLYQIARLFKFNVINLKIIKLAKLNVVIPGHFFFSLRTLFWLPRFVRRSIMYSFCFVFSVFGLLFLVLCLGMVSLKPVQKQLYNLRQYFSCKTTNIYTKYAFGRALFWVWVCWHRSLIHKSVCFSRPENCVAASDARSGWSVCCFPIFVAGIEVRGSSACFCSLLFWRNM